MNKLIYTAAICMMLFIACDTENTTPFAPTAYTIERYESLPEPLIPADNELTVEGVALGNKLFFEKRMSKDNSQSCGSCHNQELAFTDNGLALSVGVEDLEGRRNSMPIFNLAWHNTGFFWDGRAPRLRDQAILPIQDPLEMNETLENVIAKLEADSDYPELFSQAFGDEEITADRIGLALEQYMMSIVSADSKFDRVQKGEDTFTASEQRGFDLFFTERTPGGGSQGAECFHCHGGALLTNNAFMNNGLDTDAEFTDLGRFEVTNLSRDRARFKVPSLRNIELTAPYMHDGRFQTLEEVVEHYNSGVVVSSTLDPNMHTIIDGLQLTQQQKDDLVAFMKTLTDQTYINNPEYQEGN